MYQVGHYTLLTPTKPYTNYSEPTKVLMSLILDVPDVSDLNDVCTKTNGNKKHCSGASIKCNQFLTHLNSIHPYD